MKYAHAVFYKSLYDTYQNLGIILWGTILWWLSVLPVLTLGPATAGLFYVIKRSRSDVSVGPRDYWYGFKKFFWVGIRLTIIYLIVVVPGLTYFIVLISMSHFLAYFFAMSLLYFILMWHLILLYTMPLLIEQEITEVTVLLRRSLRLVTENYFFTINIVLYMFLMTLICSIFTILLVVWAGWLAMTAYNSLLYLLNKYEPSHYHFQAEVNWKGSIRPWEK